MTIMPALATGAAELHLVQPGSSISPLTEDERKLLKTPTRLLNDRDKLRKRAICRQEQQRKRSEKKAKQSKRDRQEELKRKREAEALRWSAKKAKQSERDKQQELKEKREAEALRRAGMTRSEHEKILQQEREVYQARMSAMSESDRSEMIRRVENRRRSQRGKDG